MIISIIYEKLKQRMTFPNKAAFSRAIFGSRNSLAMIERRGRISAQARERLADALRRMGHMDLVMLLLCERIRCRLPGRLAPPDHLLTSTVVISDSTDPAAAISELRGQGFPVIPKKVWPNTRSDAAYGEMVLETSDEGAVYSILSGWARPGLHKAWIQPGGPHR